MSLVTSPPTTGIRTASCPNSQRWEWRATPRMISMLLCLSQRCGLGQSALRWRERRAKGRPGLGGGATPAGVKKLDNRPCHR